MRLASALKEWKISQIDWGMRIGPTLPDSFGRTDSVCLRVVGFWLSAVERGGLLIQG